MYTEEELETNLDCYRKCLSQYIKQSDAYTKSDLAILGHFILSLSEKSEQPRVIDLGVGSGRKASILHDYGCKVTGLDFVPEFKYNLIKSTLGNIDCITGEFLSMELSKYYENFHGVHCASFLHQFKPEDINSVILKIKDLLMQRGLLFIAEQIEHTNLGWMLLKKHSNYSEGSKRYKTIFIPKVWQTKIEACGFRNLSYLLDVDAVYPNKIWWSGVWMKE